MRGENGTRVSLTNGDLHHGRSQVSELEVSMLIANRCVKSITDSRKGMRFGGSSSTPGSIEASPSVPPAAVAPLAPSSISTSSCPVSSTSSWSSGIVTGSAMS